MMAIHLGKYRSLMPTLALVFHLVNAVDGRATGPIDESAALAGAAWCEYLEAHARRIYQSAHDGDPEAALQLAERIKTSLPNPFTARDVVRKGWSGLDSTDAVHRVLLILEDREWVKPVDAPSGPSGGHPTAKYWVNPALRPAAPGGRMLPMSYLARFLKNGGFLREGTDKTDGTPPMHEVLSVPSVTSGMDPQKSAPTLPLPPPRPDDLADWPIPCRDTETSDAEARSVIAAGPTPLPERGPRDFRLGHRWLPWHFNPDGSPK